MKSADRVWTDGYWARYLVLLFVVELHGGVSLYRLCLVLGAPTPAGAGAALRRSSGV